MNSAVEKIYSEAVFEIARESNCVDSTDEELNAVAGIFNDNPGLAKLLSAPTVSFKEKLSVLEKVFGGRLSDTAYNLLCVVTEKGRAELIPAIAEDYRSRRYETENIAEVKVTTSVPLSDGLRSKLKAKLEAVYKKTVILTERVDPSIMGGIVINYGNTMMDGSVKSKLEALQKQIKGVIA